jgi:hypothetical protein
MKLLQPKETMKNWLLLFSLILFLFSCRNKQFNAEKWKTEKDEQFYMLEDIVKNKRFLGKTKNEIIKLLDTTSIKQFKYSDNSWMFIILIPNARATQSPVEVMYIDFKNDKVNNVTIEN